jgi:hypothetical protein
VSSFFAGKWYQEKFSNEEPEIIEEAENNTDLLSKIERLESENELLRVKGAISYDILSSPFFTYSETHIEFFLEGDVMAINPEKREVIIGIGEERMSVFIKEDAYPKAISGKGFEMEWLEEGQRVVMTIFATPEILEAGRYEASAVAIQE